MKHFLFIFSALFIILGIPALFFSDWSAVFNNGGVDAVTGASLDVPDTPSGNFYVFLNKTYHSDLEEWQNFFEEKPVGVIFEDISCQVLAGDAAGIQLAERYLARLAENQMKLSAGNPTLLASKIESGKFDVAIVSKEIAEIFSLEKVFSNDGILVIPIQETAG